MSSNNQLRQLIYANADNAGSGGSGGSGGGGESSGPLSYIASIGIVNSSSYSATVIHNTFDEDAEFTRDSAGIFLLNLPAGSGGWVVQAFGGVFLDEGAVKYVAGSNGGGEIFIAFVDENGDNADPKISGLFIEVRQYPSQED